MTPDPVQIAAWLAALAFLVILANGIFKLTDRLKEKPVPLETYVTKESCAIEHRHSHDRLSRAEGDILEIRKEIQILVSSLNEMNAKRATELQAHIASLRSELSDSLRRVHARIDDIPGQIIITLKNTGALD